MRLYLYRSLQNFSSDLEPMIPNLDLGFSIRVKVNNSYPLKSTALVELSKLKVGSVIESRLKACSFLIIKTHGSDKYDRYLVDVFYLKGEANEDLVFKEGVFLNNELLESGLGLAVT